MFREQVQARGRGRGADLRPTKPVKRKWHSVEDTATKCELTCARDRRGGVRDDSKGRIEKPKPLILHAQGY